MKKLIAGLIFSFSFVSVASANNVLVNGSFETGNFNGWSAGSTQNSPFVAALYSFPNSAIARNDSNTANSWVVKNNNAPYFDSVAPYVATPISNFSAFNGFDGSPGYFHLEQAFTYSGGSATANLSFDWAIQSQYSGLSRSFSANLLNSGHSVVANLFNYVQPTGDQRNWTVTHTALSLDSTFSSLGAGNYTLQFRIDIPQDYTGPAQFALDNVALDVTPIPEPETYAGLLAGLGLLGFDARRRKQKAA